MRNIIGMCVESQRVPVFDAISRGGHSETRQNGDSLRAVSVSQYGIRRSHDTQQQPSDARHTLHHATVP
jgi:hypothetical protein